MASRLFSYNIFGKTSRLKFLKNDNKLVFDTFDLALKNNSGAKPIFHSDRGFKYTSKLYKFKLDKAGMIQ